MQYYHALFFVGVFIALITPAMPLWAQNKAGPDAQDAVYTIKNVAVDVTADSASQARKQAFDNAQRKAFKKLLSRIVGDDALNNITLPGTQKIGALVKNYGIDDEQVSKVRYKAAYSFTFQKEAVRDFLSDRGIAYSETRGAPLLILPFFQQGTRLNLWRGYNPWLSVWSDSAVLEGLLPLEVPLGDLQDVRNINGDNALTYAPEDLQKMLKRYGAKEAVLLIAAFNEGPPPRSMDAPAYTPLTIYIYRTDNKAPQFVRSLYLRPDTGASLRDLLRRGVKEVAGFLRKDWKQQTAVQPGQRETIEAVVRFGGLEEWLGMKTRLRELGGVDSLEIRTLSADRARLALAYRGTMRQFSRTLRREGLQANTFYPGRRGRYGGDRGKTPDPVMNIRESSGVSPAQPQQSPRRPRQLRRQDSRNTPQNFNRPGGTYQQRGRQQNRSGRPESDTERYNRRNDNTRRDRGYQNRSSGNSDNTGYQQFQGYEGYQQNQRGY